MVSVVSSIFTIQISQLIYLPCQKEIRGRKQTSPKPRPEIPLPRTSPKTGHEEPRVAIERGTPQGCGGTEQAEEY